MTKLEALPENGRVTGGNIMLRYVAFCACLALGGVVNAEGIHKCVTSDGTVYQGSPCARAEAPFSTAVPSAVNAPTVPARPAVPDCLTPGGPPARPPWRHGTICIGMSDDEVLNLAGWGRPARIVRKRARVGWQEEWTYESRIANAATLRFVNAKLASVETEPPRVLVAWAALTQQ